MHFGQIPCGTNRRTIELTLMPNAHSRYSIYDIMFRAPFTALEERCVGRSRDARPSVAFMRTAACNRAYADVQAQAVPNCTALAGSHAPHGCALP